MSGNEATLRLIEVLEACGIPYLMVGSYASNIYGVERATNDADIVVELGETEPMIVFRQLTPSIRFDPQMTFETVTMTRRFVGEVVGIPFKIELFLLSDDPHDRERFLRRQPVEILGRRVFVLSREDVIITKLRWARTKDKDDLREVIAVQGDRIDWPYVDHWCAIHGTAALLDEIRRSIPPI